MAYLTYAKRNQCRNAYFLISFLIHLFLHTFPPTFNNTTEIWITLKSVGN